jgi:hypothetical protein
VFLTVKTRKHQASAEFVKTLADGRKGPQMRPHPTEKSRYWMAQWEMREAGKRTMLARANNKFRVLPLDQLRGLPRATSDNGEGGVYFLWFGPELIYIGKGVRVGDRIHRHRKDGVRPFTHATYLPGPDQLIRDFESDYVQRYHPPFNFTGTG